jgi:hypothetical protein
MEEVLNILNDKYIKVERGVVDILLSIVLAFDLCDHRKSVKSVRRIFRIPATFVILELAHLKSIVCQLDQQCMKLCV